MSLRSAATSATGSVISRCFTRARRPSSSAVVTFTPRSARNIASSRSSHVAWSMALRRSTPVVALANTPRARERRSRKVGGAATGIGGVSTAACAGGTVGAGATGGGGVAGAVTGAGAVVGAGTTAGAERRERRATTTPPPTTTTVAAMATYSQRSFTPTWRRRAPPPRATNRRAAW